MYCLQQLPCVVVTASDKGWPVCRSMSVGRLHIGVHAFRTRRNMFENPAAYAMPCLLYIQPSPIHVQALVFAAGKAMQAAGARPPPIFSPVTSAAARAVSHVQVCSLARAQDLYPASYQRVGGGSRCLHVVDPSMADSYALVAGCQPICKQTSGGSGGVAVTH